MQRLALAYGSDAGWVWLRELEGRDEESVAGTDTESALALLDRLLVDRPGAAVGAGRADELAVPDRDRLLAAVYLAEFGRRVESTATCRACGQPYDLDFSLDDVLAGAGGEGGGPVRESGGIFRLADGRRFRLPRGSDERAAASAPPERMQMEILRRCMIDGGEGTEPPPTEPGSAGLGRSLMIDGSAADDPAAIIEGMAQAGPLLDLELDAPCPECQHAQEVRFDMQSYLLTRILDERRQRAVELHRIAAAYGWALAEILALPRSRRRLLAELIDRDRAVR